jgi:hypothetical protein
MAAVHIVETSSGDVVVLKARAGIERAAACVEGQRRLRSDGFPCPAPLTAVEEVNGLGVHAEEYVPGGAELEGHSDEVAVSFASLLADLVGRLERLEVPVPPGTPIWAGWDHQGIDLWPDPSERREDLLTEERVVVPCFDAPDVEPKWLLKQATKKSLD